MAAGCERFESVEQAFKRICEEVTREFHVAFQKSQHPRLASEKIYLASFEEGDDLAVIMEHTGLLEHIYQSALRKTNFKACPTRWHQDILKLHLMARVAISSRPGHYLCYSPAFQLYVKDFLGYIDGYINAAAEKSGLTPARMSYFYWRLIFHSEKLMSWPGSLGEQKQIKYLKTLFIDKKERDRFGDWNGDRRLAFRFPFDSLPWAAYSLSALYEQANSLLEQAYDNVFTSKLKSPIIHRSEGLSAIKDLASSESCAEHTEARSSLVIAGAKLSQTKPESKTCGL
ncbi:MAG: hypothetical protein K0S29_1054 [Gammaproteobacteria bacterium]|jgi:hypothetical protein|nr:hypothetical protein [Gammaproteobacteria bacterium]